MRGSRVFSKKNQLYCIMQYITVLWYKGGDISIHTPKTCIVTTLLCMYVCVCGCVCLWLCVLCVYVYVCACVCVYVCLSVYNEPLYISCKHSYYSHIVLYSKRIRRHFRECHPNIVMILKDLLMLMVCSICVYVVMVTDSKYTNAQNVCIYVYVFTCCMWLLVYVYV